MFVPFYCLHWIYKSTQRIDRLPTENEMYSEITTVSLFLVILFRLTEAILIQDKINTTVKAKA